jgi:DNA polymerase-3 subunit chi
MTDVSFHFNVADRPQYICRLARKASRQGAQVVLSGPAPALAYFDRCLWTFDELEFLPHAVWRDTDAQAAMAVPGLRVWLAEDPTRCAHRDVLINLGELPPPGYEHFGRLVEVVSSEQVDRAAARVRWKHYTAQGHAIQRFEVGA